MVLCIVIVSGLVTELKNNHIGTSNLHGELKPLFDIEIEDQTTCEMRRFNQV